MEKSKTIVLTSVILTLLITMACGFGAQKATSEPTQQIENTAVMKTSVENAGETGATKEAIQPKEQTAPADQESTSSEESPFPVTDDATNIIATSDSVNFQTKMSLNDSIEHYRQVFTSQGLTEDGLLTAITDTTFSMVFEGSANGRALVIQGVDLGNGSTNINIRYEDL